MSSIWSFRADRDAIERAGKNPPEYVLMAIQAAEGELARRDAKPDR